MVVDFNPITSRAQRELRGLRWGCDRPAPSCLKQSVVFSQIVGLPLVCLVHVTFRFGRGNLRPQQSREIIAKRMETPTLSVDQISDVIQKWVSRQQDKVYCVVCQLGQSP